ncbi:hypothetical protein CFH99_07745 [Nocardioides aromaticivorans]|uniref:Uncharacterized protein n=1 Tax=Nocardioides aromaticivorans TaxID=200618 RepID=A0ABX7PIB1_9ACTN|nr:hypothetical protein [Nocardioides aromaticivorans]QSR25515.1 hypothetical protein CFH99_07745 [Nocardioides aromaticivorans]
MADPVLILGYVAGGLASLAVIGKWVRSVWRWGRGLARTLDAVHGLVEHELKPNSGGSLFDMVKRIDDWRGLHITEAAADRERLAAVEAKLGMR